MRNANLSNVERPSQDWTLDRLEKYALSCVNKIAGFGRKTIQRSWLFGEAIALIQKLKKGQGEWMEWLKTQPFSHGTASNAISVRPANPVLDVKAARAQCRRPSAGGQDASDRGPADP